MWNVAGSAAEAVLSGSGTSCRRWASLPAEMKHRVVYGEYAKTGQFLNGYGRAKVIQSVDAFCAWSHGAGVLFLPVDNQNSSNNTDSSSTPASAPDSTPDSTPSSGQTSSGPSIDLNKLITGGLAAGLAIYSGLNQAQQAQAQRDLELQILKLRGQLPTNPGLQTNYAQLLQLQAAINPQGMNSSTLVILLAVAVVGVGAFALSRQSRGRS